MKKGINFIFIVWLDMKFHFSPLISFPSSPLLPLYFFKPNMYLKSKKETYLATSKLEKSTQTKNEEIPTPISH